MTRCPHPRRDRQGAWHAAEVGRVGWASRDKPGLDQYLLRRGILAGDGRPERAQPVSRRGHLAQLPDGRGLYWQWTRKIAAKTICRWLSPEQQHDYQAWIDNDRRLRDLLARLEALGAAALEADPRWKRKSPATPGHTSQSAP